MEDVATPTPSQPTKKTTTLSVDRAAFLLLRVKKAFKKKRQQRKEKQAQQGGAFAAGQSSTHGDSRKIPPPLLRSRTLPAIIMPGQPAVSMNTTQDKQTTRLDERTILGGKQSGCSKNAGFNRWSLLTRSSNANNNNNSCSHINHNTLSVKSLHLPNDDSTLSYRRKSSGSTPYPFLNQQQQHQQQQKQQHHQPQPLQQQQQYYAGDGSYFQLSDNFECHADGSLLLRIPAPHVVAARAYHFAPKRRIGNTAEATADTLALPISIHDADEGGEDVGSGAGTSSGSTALTRLAKLLHQTSKSTIVTPPSQQKRGSTDCANTPPLGSTLGLREEAPRRLSWERRKDSSALQRSASIDSFAEIVFSDMPHPGLDLPRGTAPPFSKRPSTSSLYSNYHFYGGAGGDIALNISGGGGGSSAANSRRESLLSPSSTRRNKLNRNKNALFSAVEHGHLEKARTIIESIDVDVNCTNTDGLSALDVAVLSNNRSMTRMLLQHGAIDSSQFSAESIGAKLNGLLKDAESRINDLSAAEAPCQSVFLSRPSISSIIIGNTGSSVTGCTGSEVEKQIGIWERRVKSLRRLLLGWDQARPPDMPASVTVDVTNENSITVQILEPFEGAIGTKFKVQWSTRTDFGNIVGERELADWTNFHGTMGAQCHIGGLTQGRRYFIRCACGNIKDWSAYKTSVPASVVPSSWRDLNNRHDRYFGRQRVLDELFTAVRLTRPAEASDITLDPAGSKRIHKKKTTIKQLFSVASKFQKTLRRGIYLASIVYYDDKVLVTSEDFPPVIEIDESYPSSLHMDYYWLMKVACTWDDVKLLRSDMERHLTSAVHFRTKILSAICQMQSALFTDLGLLYYKPLRDSKGTVVIACIQSVKSPKSVSILNSRWLPVHKLQKKIGALHEDSSINELLISSIDDQIQYHQTALQTLEPGLYLGYLKMQCSMDQIQVVVPVKSPNVLPHQRVRENSHISAEEWQILHRDGKYGTYGECASNKLRFPLEFNIDPESTSEVQRLFLYDLTNAAHKLFASMNIKQAEAVTHRFYDVEVIEISKEISFLLICPSVELSCAVPGQTELLLQRDDFVSLSVQAFEMIHLRTYQPIILQKYARLSCILELDTTLANHSHREAFSTTELQCAKERLAKLQELTNSLNSMWKGMRWLMDVIAFARDKNAPQESSVMRDILDFAHAQEDGNSGSNKQHLLQLPIREQKFNKVGSGRGSWPGPGADIRLSNSSSGPEHSKSEQNLDMTVITPVANYANKSLFPATAQPNEDMQQLMPAPDVSQRKNSGDSQQTTHSFYSVMSSNMDLGGSSSNSVFAIPPSRSDDTLALAAPDLLRHTQGVLTHRKRTSTSCSISQAKSMSTPLITVQSASSTPYLAGSSLSLKGCYTTEFEHKPIKSETELNKDHAVAQRHTLHLVPSSATGQQQVHETKGDKQTGVPITPTTGHASTSAALTRPTRDEDAESCTSLGSEQTSGIIQVYTAYNTGLASGTSLKLHVTHKTTAREVINLVVKQLNMAAVLKGSNGPIYTAEMLENFCLVAVIGARERCLRDDFKPLQLQSPWRKGRLYVRQKHELLAAIEHSNRKSHLI